MDIPREALDPDNWQTFLAPSPQDVSREVSPSGVPINPRSDGVAKVRMKSNPSQTIGGRQRSGEGNRSRVSVATPQASRHQTHQTWPYPVDAPGMTYRQPQFQTRQLYGEGRISRSSPAASITRPHLSPAPLSPCVYDRGGSSHVAASVPTSPVGHTQKYQTSAPSYNGRHCTGVSSPPLSGFLRCHGSSLGCPWIGSQSDIHAHQSNCFLYKICSRILQLESSNGELQQRVKELEETVDKLEKWPLQFRTLRLKQEVKECLLNPLQGFDVEISEDLLTWKCRVPGLKGTIHEGALYPITMEFGYHSSNDGNGTTNPDEDANETENMASLLFPFVAPRVRFPNYFFHPNVYANGEVNLAFLADAKLWDPTLSVNEILLSIQDFLGRIDFTRMVQTVSSAEQSEQQKTSNSEKSDSPILEKLRLQALEYKLQPKSYRGKSTITSGTVHNTNKLGSELRKHSRFQVRRASQPVLPFQSPLRRSPPACEQAKAERNHSTTSGTSSREFSSFHKRYDSHHRNDTAKYCNPMQSSMVQTRRICMAELSPTEERKFSSFEVHQQKENFGDVREKNFSTSSEKSPTEERQFSSFEVHQQKENSGDVREKNFSTSPEMARKNSFMSPKKNRTPVSDASSSSLSQERTRRRRKKKSWSINYRVFRTGTSMTGFFKSTGVQATKDKQPGDSESEKNTQSDAAKTPSPELDRVGSA